MKATSTLMALALSPLALAVWGTFPGAAVAQTRTAIQPVYTNKTQFRIPFRYDEAEMQRLGAQEIRLYLSMDQGKTWRLSRQANPRAAKFDFQAQSAGEYWFAVRTLDRENQLYPPEQTMEPGLKVVVDHAPPTLAIQLRQDQPGKVKLSWQADDANLDASKLRLEYVQTGSDHWETVSVLPQATGQTAWSVSQGGFVAVRGHIEDLAGNVRQAQSQIRIEPEPAVPNLNDPIASPTLNNSLADVNPLGNAGLPPAAPNPFAENGSLEPSRSMPSVPPIIPNQPGSAGNLISNHPQTQPAIVGNRYEEPTPVRQPPKITKNTRVVNSRKFQIGYKVEDVGPSGVGDVELFITEDDGAKWFKYGNDLDRQSPFQVDTPRDGIYGFALQVRSGAGAANAPPQPGDKPSIVVVVDQTPPAVKLLSADQGRGPTLNQVVIRWSITDDYPSETPAALSYASDPGGLWEPISGWVANPGEYVWNVGPNAPPRLYFRVTARDAAGNLSRSETTEPVIVDLSKPSARIVDVESISTAVLPRR